MRRLASISAAVVLCTASVACTSTDALRTDAGAEPRFAIVSRHEAVAARTSAVPVETLVPPAGSERRFVALAGARKGKVVVQRTVDAGEGRLAIEEQDGAPSERFVLEPRDGGYAISMVETYGEDSRSVFARPLLFAPARLTPGEQHPCDSPMEVTLLSNGKPRASGTARRNLRITGEAEIDLHGERLRATVVEVEFVAELDAATARRVSELFVVADRGVVAEQWRERLLILGVIPRNSRETLVIQPTKGAAR
jgi:hypothetical protein